MKTIPHAGKRDSVEPITTAHDSNPETKTVMGTEPGRCAMIEEAAYFLAEKRGFVGDFQMEDWLAAEHEIDQLLLKRSSQPI